MSNQRSALTYRSLQHGKLCLATADPPTKNTTSEDCLFLDVYAPERYYATSSSSKPKQKGLPVFVFIQGGGFNSNSNPNLNATGLIEASGNNIVVVTFNYRVGPYGFLASKEIAANASTNNGLKDQLKVLQWVQKYIAFFGGDPSHVTIGGDSAGAASVSLLLSAYGGRDDGLFHASAAESISFATVYNVTETQFIYDRLVRNLGCSSSSNTLACIRSKSAVEVQTVNNNTALPGAQDPPLYMYGPVIDGSLIQDYTYRAFNTGAFIKVPSISGDDTNGGTVFTPKSTNSSEASSRFLKDQFPALTTAQLAKIAQLYPVEGTPQFPDSGRYWRQVSNAYGEMRYLCPGLFIASAQANRGVKAYNYRYNVEDPTQVAQGLGVPHTVEVNAIFAPNVSGAPASYATTNAPEIPVIQGYWQSFIRSFDPNLYRAKGSPVWELWQESQMDRLLFQTNNNTMETVDPGQWARCQYLWSIGVAIKQ